jgi:hypothetical protein
MEHIDYLLKCLASVTFVEMRDADRCASGAWTFIMKDYVTVAEDLRAQARDDLRQRRAGRGDLLPG